MGDMGVYSYWWICCTGVLEIVAFADVTDGLGSLLDLFWLVTRLELQEFGVATTHKQIECDTDIQWQQIYLQQS